MCEGHQTSQRCSQPVSRYLLEDACAQTAPPSASPVGAPRPRPVHMRTASRWLWCHVPGASHRLLGGCFLWLSPPPPGGRGKLGGSGLEKARFWFGSAARYATCPLPGVWSLGAAGEIETAWVGPGRARQREDARVWGARRRPRRGRASPEPRPACGSGASHSPAPHPGRRFAVDCSRNLTLGVTYACALTPGNLAALLIPAPDAGSCLFLNPHATSRSFKDL